MSLHYINIINLLCTVDRQGYTHLCVCTFDTQIDDSIKRIALFSLETFSRFSLLSCCGSDSNGGVGDEQQHQNDIDPAMFL